MSENTAIATIDTFRLPADLMTDSDITSEKRAEDVEDVNVTYPVIKIPSGGGIFFEIPGDEPGARESAKVLEGVVVDHHRAGAYWAESGTEESGPPDCSSADGRYGIGNLGGKCADCHLNRFGSGEGGRGKACKNTKVIYFQREGRIMPDRINLPPTSIKAFDDYISDIQALGLISKCVITRITLETKKSGSNNYSQAVFRLGGYLSKDIYQKILAYSDELKKLTRQNFTKFDENNHPILPMPRPANIDADGVVTGEGVPS